MREIVSCKRGGGRKRKELLDISGGQQMENNYMDDNMKPRH